MKFECLQCGCIFSMTIEYGVEELRCPRCGDFVVDIDRKEDGEE